MNASPNTDTPVSAAPPALWRVAEAFMHILYGLFGNPEDVAAQDTLTAKAYELMASWLRAGEALLRRLLLIEAAAYPRPNTRHLLWPKRTRVRRLRTFLAEKPEQWRVSFRCLLSDKHARRARRQVDGDKADAGVSPKKPRVSREDRWSYENFKPQTFHSAWPLAERYEALLRAYNNPAPFARRLAARLHATPHRVEEVLRASDDVRGKVGFEGYAAVDEAARQCWRPPPRVADTSRRTTPRVNNS